MCCSPTYFWPRRAHGPGLHLGAVVLALKTAVYGLVSVQVYDWLNCHFLGIRYAAILGRRISAIVTVGVIAGALLGVGGPLLRRSGIGTITALGLSSCAYALMIAASIWLYPGLAGLTRANWSGVWVRYAEPEMPGSLSRGRRRASSPVSRDIRHVRHMA